MVKPRDSGQTAYEIGHVKESSDVDTDVMRAMYLYSRRDLGLGEDFSQSRATSELERGGPKSIVQKLTSAGIALVGKNVLDLGAGLGGMSEELVLQGARTFAIEPGASWASLAQRRVGRHEGNYELHRSVGESLPFENESMDVVISLQVLEHVQDPRKVLAEIERVLRPGGHFYLACENYLAFKEAHYKVFWLPLLPKQIGSLYLRLRGRSPAFLKESITYVTFPQVMIWSRQLGLHRCRDEHIGLLVQHSPGMLGAMMRLLNLVTGGRAARIGDRAYRTFRFGIWELFYKPLNINS